MGYLFGLRRVMILFPDLGNCERHDGGVELVAEFVSCNRSFLFSEVFCGLSLQNGR